MATTTTNIGLVKPALTDVADIQVINANMDKIDTKFKNIESVYAPKTHTHVSTEITGLPTSLPANGGNSTTVGGFSALGTPVTTEKTNIIKMINEVFTNANDGKTSIANVIGGTVVGNDTFDKMASEISRFNLNLRTYLTTATELTPKLWDLLTFAYKRTTELTTQLSNKGVATNGSVSIPVLISKISEISTGKKIATGTVVTPLNTSYTITCPFNYTLAEVWVQNSGSDMYVRLLRKSYDNSMDLFVAQPLNIAYNSSTANSITITNKTNEYYQNVAYRFYE